MKTGDDRTVVHTSTNPVAHSNPLSSIPTDVSYDVLASPIDEIPPASPPPMTNRKSFARPTITSTEGVDLIEDSKHLDGFAPAITAPFQMDDQHSTSGSEERNETEVRRRQASATDLDDIVIRIETTKDAHRHHHAGDNVSVKSLSKQEYNVLKSRKEATLDYLESCNNIYGLKHLGSKPSDHRSQVVSTVVCRRGNSENVISSLTNVFSVFSLVLHLDHHSMYWTRRWCRWYWPPLDQYTRFQAQMERSL